MPKKKFRPLLAMLWIGLVTALPPSSALADAGGLSFWLPGTFGSLAAAPAVPGWSYASIYLHLEATGGRGANFVLPGGGRGAVAVGLTDHADVLVQGVTFTSALPVLGGQAAFTVLGAPGNVGVGISGAVTGPLGNTISGARTDNRTTLADVFYQGTLKWNQGVHNEMVYVSGNIPSGTYDPGRLANLSFGFAAFDAGGGYTYFDPKAGNEFSVVAGLTYSLPNPDLQYQNGIDFHLDWAASKFLTKTVQVGLAGYYFQQITDDRGPGAVLGGFRGMSVGIGPQLGFLLPNLLEGYQGYLNLKAYKDLETENRPNGWSSWVTFQISPQAPEPPATKPLTRKY
jgi:hypothetical protein